MSKRWLMVADAHLSCCEPEDEFFRMLDSVSRLPGDIGIVFLGDIFDLWIALRGYENEEHRRFLDWCRREKARREIVFLEGNHEFFVAKTYPDAFSYSDEDSYRDGTTQWLHGDRINRRDHSYKILRFILRNILTRWFLWCIGPTFGPSFAHYVRERLRTTNQAHKTYFPEQAALNYLSSCPPDFVVFAGHFHDRLTRTSDGRTLEVLPAYAQASELMYYDPAVPELSVLPAARVAGLCGSPDKKEASGS
ncbi:MAG: metallophosphoesterase [Lentisphaeria bacterium]|nr:metallophosphoesterase [Lentisphaeria bacterium]MBR3506206.1 metallophosphoesterase [Lentisphaeria bacterium]